MALTMPGAEKGAHGESLFGKLIALLRSFPEQAKLALGIRGVALAAAAGAIGLLSCAVSLADITLSLQGSDIARHRREAEAFANLDQSTRTLMRSIHLLSYGTIRPAEAAPLMSQAWVRLEKALNEACGDVGATPQSNPEAERPICRAGRSLHDLLAPEIVRFDPATHPLDPATLAQVMVVLGQFNDASTAATHQANSLVDRMASDYGEALFVLTLSTAGFAGAGLVLLLLVARASMSHYLQWRKAAASAGEAMETRDVLRETIEAIPAGIVVYGQDERLLLFNSAAASVNPALLEPGAIGRSFEEMCVAMAQRADTEGRGVVSIEPMLQRFREGGRVRPPYRIDGRWLELSEQRTPSGRTVGLRIDVTDLKNREIELERARARFQGLVDSLSDMVYELDVETGRVTYVSASVADLLGIPADRLIGGHFLDYIAEESKAEVARITTRPYSEGDGQVFYRFRMKTASGEIRNVEVRARRRVDDDGRVISAGVIRDIEERVQLERRLADEAARLRAMFETGGAMVALLDRDMRYTMVNREFTRVTGRTPEQLVGRTFEEVFGQPAQIDQPMLDRWLSGPLPAGHREMMRYPMTVVDADGRKRSFNVTANPVTDRDGIVQQIVFLVVEDTERLEALELLKETLDTVPAGITLWDRDQRLVMFNAVAATINPRLRQPSYIGRPYSEIVGELVEDIRKTGIEAARDVLDGFRATTSARRQLQLPDGRWFDWSERDTPSGHTVGLRVDITDLKHREMEAEQARVRYQSLVDSLSDMVYALDAKGRFTFASRAAANLLGVTADRLIGQKFADFLVPDDFERARETASAFLKSSVEGVRQVQLRLRRADGAIRHFEFRFRKPPDAVGRDAGVGVMRDVTERVDLTERLQKQIAEVEQARAEYEALVDSLSDLVVKIDPETGIITFASAAAFELWGYSPSELVGRRVFDFVAGNDVERMMAEARAAFKDPKGVKQLHYRARARNGEERHVEGRFRVMPGANGKAVIVGVTQDIEQRVQLERRLAEETARLRSVFETGGVVMALMDRDLRYLMVNQDFTNAVGLPKDRIIGRTPKEVLGGVGLDLAMIGRWKSAPLRPGHDEVMRYTRSFRDLEGRQRYFPTTVRPIADKEGNLQQLLLLAVDDTERRDAERALFDAERFTIVGEMAATLAHEISQPLQVINIACASAMDEFAQAREADLPVDVPFVEGKIARVGQQVERATRIVGELRAFVRGTAEEDAASFDPAIAVRGAIDLTGHGVRQAGSVVTASVAPALPSLVGHIGRLEQVLINLINNARDAGAPAIEVHARKIDRDGRSFVRIAVEDSGPGIEPQVLPRLFESFVTTKPRGQGTGLGLRICRRIVEEMGGTISALNRSEGGACFEILLPAASSLST